MQGWLPKPGAQFGGHFVLYRCHPEVDHAEYVVRCMRGRQPVAQPLQPSPEIASQKNGVKCLDEVPAGATASASSAVESPLSQHFEWPELLASLRVAGQVRKRLLLLYVHFPAGTQHESPACLECSMVRLAHAGGVVANECALVPAGKVANSILVSTVSEDEFLLPFRGKVSVAAAVAHG
jgi:hypothetical protein